MSSISLPGVLAVPVTNNDKTGPLAVTHLSQATCPPCPFRGNGCFAEGGYQAFTTRRMNGQVVRPDTAAWNEVQVIDLLPADRPLRLHIVGDVLDLRHARLLRSAVDRYGTRFHTYGRRVTGTWRHFKKLAFLYTHNHTIPREAFGPEISVLRSCDRGAQVRQAWADNFAAAITVPHHPSRRVYQYDGIDVLPCLKEVGLHKNCATCGVCANDDMLRGRRMAIGFIARGTKRRAVRAYLDRMRGRV